MSPRSTGGKTALDRLRRRYETTDTKCPDCGYVDDEAHWTARTDGNRIVYHYTCPSCQASRDHTFEIGR